MKTFKLKPSIPLKPIDHIKVQRTVEQLENIIQSFGVFRCSSCANTKEWNESYKTLTTAKYELYVLRRQEVRRKNREDKAAQVGFWSKTKDYYYIPKAINYEHFTNN